MPSCSITSGRERQCKNTVGGAKTLFLAPLSDFATGVDYDVNGQIDTLPEATVYRFEVDPTSSSLSLVSTIQASPDNGTTFFEHVITGRFKKISNADTRNFANLAVMQLVAFVLDNNGNLLACGIVNGCDVTAGENMNTGNAMGDMSGYTITLTARESEPPRHLTAYTTNPFDNFADITVSPAYPAAS